MFRSFLWGVKTFLKQLFLDLLMVRGKRVREKGKIKLSHYFKKLEKGEKVSVVPEKSVRAAFPKRIIGLSGTVEGMRGKFGVVGLKEKNKLKRFIIHPVHLKKIK